MNQAANTGVGGAESTHPDRPTVASATQPADEAEPEDERDVGLIELLQSLANERGKGRAAERLGVDRKTLSGALSRGRLTPRLRSALKTERLATERAVADDLQARVQRLEAALQDLRLQSADDVQSLRTQLATLGEELQAVSAVANEPNHVGAGTTNEPVGVHTPRRVYPELVTTESALDDEAVYGAAWPVVLDWRRERASFKRHWPTLSGREAEVRMLNLAICLVEEHQLTLPPQQMPWEQFQRRDALVRLRGRLADARTDLRRVRRRSWLLRLVTLGLRGR